MTAAARARESAPGATGAQRPTKRESRDGAPQARRKTAGVDAGDKGMLHCRTARRTAVGTGGCWRAERGAERSAGRGNGEALRRRHQSAHNAERRAEGRSAAGAGGAGVLTAGCMITSAAYNEQTGWWRHKKAPRGLIAASPIRERLTGAESDHEGSAPTRRSTRNGTRERSERRRVCVWQGLLVLAGYPYLALHGVDNIPLVHPLAPCSCLYCY